MEMASGDGKHSVADPVHDVAKEGVAEAVGGNPLEPAFLQRFHPLITEPRR